MRARTIALFATTVVVTMIAGIALGGERGGARALPAAASGNGGCVAVLASSPQLNGGAFAQSFSATKIIDINLSVLFVPGIAKQFTGIHELEVRVFTPKGNLYESMAVPFTSDGTRGGEKHHLDGYPEPKPVHVLKGASYNGAQQIGTSVVLPVAGTPILNNSLYGRWTAEAHVDGQRVPCSSTASFSITQ